MEAVEAPVGAVREPPLPAPERKGLRDRLMAGISRNVIVLGLVSFFTDVSSEMIVPVRILFLVIVLHTPLPLAGLIEGVAESTASLLLNTSLSIVSFGEDKDGELYLAHWDASRGAVYRIVKRGR